MGCDMCGAEGNLVIATVEQTQMTVCKTCGKYGKLLRPIRPPRTKEVKKEIKQESEEPVFEEIVVEDYSQQVKIAREEKGWKQKELAKILNEKESIVQKIETGNFEPPISLARKIGKTLGIILIETVAVKQEKTEKTAASEMTIGDVIKIRKRS